MKSYELVIFIDTDIKNIINICSLKEMKKGLENYDFNKPDFEKSINDVYLSRLNAYKSRMDDKHIREMEKKE